MALIDSLREVLGDPRARSFQLCGEDAMLLGYDELRRGIADYEAQVAALGPALHAQVAAAHAAFRREAHAWLGKYNTSVHRRIAGYLELGRRCEFRYPWPVVAVLGICQVLEGMQKNRGWGIAGEVMSRVGFDGLARVADNIEDVMRRTNRAIFADSVPTVLYALRALAAARRGEHELVHVLVEGPLPIHFDEDNRRVIRELVRALQLADVEAQFVGLAQLTLEHFEREQAIFSYHLGGARRGKRKLAARLLQLKSVQAPTIVTQRSGRGALVFMPYALPADFDMRDHEQRVRELGRAFVSAVTASREEYRIATEYAVRRFVGRAARLPA